MKGPGTGRRRLDGELLDVIGAAALLGTSEKCIRSRTARGLLPHRKWGGRVVFLRAELLDFIGKLEGCTVREALDNVATRGGHEPASGRS